mmetsp:Transcript_25014/g.79613  ORF Transcript_25014/g.79613 Transcript_25014/m.79613 type:complete len:218 (+) Transcript_25014:1-654(+)
MISNRSNINLMGDLPSKNDKAYVLAVSKRYMWYSVPRLLPTSLVVVVLFMWTLAQQAEDSADAWSTFVWARLLDQDDQAEPWTALSARMAQCSSIFALVWFMVVHGLTFSFRHASLISSPPTNLGWWISAMVVLLLQLGFSEVYLAAAVAGTGKESGGGFRWLGVVHVGYWVVLVVWPVAIILVAELCKWQDRSLHARNQRRLRVLYETRLGMYSPR